jgi:hypothetical protein
LRKTDRADIKIKRTNESVRRWLNEVNLLSELASKAVRRDSAPATEHVFWNTILEGFSEDRKDLKISSF